jgi:hypothetical protein
LLLLLLLLRPAAAAAAAAPCCQALKLAVLDANLSLGPSVSISHTVRPRSAEKPRSFFHVCFNMFSTRLG